MKVNQNTFELIDSFLDNEMSELERTTFHEKLKNDPVLFKEVQLQSELRNAIKVKSIAPLNKKLNAIREKVKAEEMNKNSLSKKKEFKIIPLLFRISVAAVILLLAGFFGKQFIFDQNTPDGYTLVASTQVNPSYISTTRSIILKDRPAVKTRILESTLTSTEVVSYTYQNAQLDIYVSKTVAFPVNNLNLIYFSNEDEKLSLYLEGDTKIFKIIETKTKTPLLEEKNEIIKSKIFNN